MKTNPKFLKYVIVATLFLLFNFCNAQNALVLLQEDDPLIRIKGGLWHAKNEKDEWEEKKVLELCNSERFNIRRQEVEQYWNRVIRSKKRGGGCSYFSSVLYSSLHGMCIRCVGCYTFWKL